MGQSRPQSVKNEAHGHLSPPFPADPRGDAAALDSRTGVQGTMGGWLRISRGG